MQCPPLLYGVPFTRHRPQQVEIGTVLGRSPSGAKPGYAQLAQRGASV